MIKLRDNGSINVLLLPLIVVTLLFLGTAYFGYWAYTGRQNYKDNVDTLVAAGVNKAVSAEDTKKDAQFALAEEQPLKTYSGPGAYGSIQLQYPKTWSGYVNEDSNGDTDVDGYFDPNVVPDLEGLSSVYALRVQVVNEAYSDVMRNYTNNVTAKTLTATPYSLPKVPSVIGTRLDGTVALNKQGAMIVIPLRNTTLKVWTESTAFLPDFNNNILPNLSFSP